MSLSNVVISGSFSICRGWYCKFWLALQTFWEKTLNLCLQRQKTQHQSGVCWYCPWSQQKLCDDNADEEEADYQADDDEVACEYEYMNLILFDIDDAHN